jgi:hypothetical protein
MSEPSAHPLANRKLGTSEAGLVLAIISLMVCQPLGIVALVFAILALTTPTGDNLRFAGYAKTTAWCGIGVGLVWLVGILLYMSVKVWPVFRAI